MKLGMPWPSRRPWSLQRRLIVGILVLMAIVSVAIGAITTTRLNAVLIDQLDQQLNSASGRSQDRIGTPPPGVLDPQSQIGFLLRGQGQGAIGAIVDGSTVSAGIINADAGSQQLTNAQGLLIASVKPGAPTTVDLGGKLGQYRFVATMTDDGRAIVVGLPMAGVIDTTNQLLIIVGLVTVLALVITAAGGIAVVRLALRPLDRVIATASRVSELQLAKGEVAIPERVPDPDTDPRTEVGQMGAALNKLLGHVESALTARQASEDKVRQFVADASHELRTPLASIRGYAELTRRGSYELPDDAVHSLGRIESESIRMTSLVEELLLLARLDAGTELRMEPVDLPLLLANAVADAQVAGGDHEWVLEIPDEPVQVTGDGRRLHQVVANLLANARVHTPAGTRVVAAVSKQADSAVITITDDGPGIDERILPTLFERFARGDTSRSRVAGSTGLGLAIVSAVVEAHGGTVGVDSAEGHTVFRVELPAS